MNHTGTNFDGLGIAPKVLGLLDRLKFKVPTPIQHKAQPIVMEGKDIIERKRRGMTNIVILKR